MRIIFLEPDAVLAHSYIQMFEKQGHYVAWCQSAQEAISEADVERPDAVLLELQLAGHNGLEFLYEFRSYPDWQGIPAIILSHITLERSGLTAVMQQQLGIMAYHYKPQAKLAQMAESVSRMPQQF